MILMSEVCLSLYLWLWWVSLVEFLRFFGFFSIMCCLGVIIGVWCNWFGLLEVELKVDVLLVFLIEMEVNFLMILLCWSNLL